jgi:hypothetical protein
VSAQLPTAFPLNWPRGWKRTAPSARRRGRFGKSRYAKGPPSVYSSICELLAQLRRFGAHGLVVSTNVPTRTDGYPRSNPGRIDDPGAAVYFERDRKDLVLACDCYKTVEDNLRAIVLHLDALRGMERWGVGSLDQAFAGYAQLPEDTSTSDVAPPWWSVLGFQPGAVIGEERLQKAYRDAAKRAHPDAGGSDEQFVAVQRAYQQGLEAVGARA